MKLPIPARRIYFDFFVINQTTSGVIVQTRYGVIYGVIGMHWQAILQLQFTVVFNIRSLRFLTLSAWLFRPVHFRTQKEVMSVYHSITCWKRSIVGMLLTRYMRRRIWPVDPPTTKQPSVISFIFSGNTNRASRPPDNRSCFHNKKFWTPGCHPPHEVGTSISW